MDISYILYYVMMDDLRSRLKKKFPETFLGSGNYLYSDITHVHDIERLEGTFLPSNILGEIEMTFVNHTLLQGSNTQIKRCQIYSSGIFILEKSDEELKKVLEEWMMAVKIRYITREL